MRRGASVRDLTSELAIVRNKLDGAEYELKRLLDERGSYPIPMLLTCPACGARHVDLGEFATKVHHTHACQVCGMVWRPAIVATVGVFFLPGFKDPNREP
jgi:hypothetical protein